MIFTQRRQLLKFAAVLPLATFLSPVNALTQSGFDELIKEIAHSEKLFLKIGKDLQFSAEQNNPEKLRQQLLSDSGCFVSTNKVEAQQLLLERVRDDFKNDRVVKYQGWVLSQTEVNICHLASLV